MWGGPVDAIVPTDPLPHRPVDENSGKISDRVIEPMCAGVLIVFLELVNFCFKGFINSVIVEFIELTEIDLISWCLDFIQSLKVPTHSGGICSVEYVPHAMEEGRGDGFIDAPGVAVLSLHFVDSDGDLQLAE